MKVIAFTNGKGGSGKTATAFNVGCELSRRGKRVLLWDIDPQASLTECFKLTFPQDQLYTEDVLSTDKLDVTRAPINISENLYLIPATKALGAVQGTLEFEGNYLRLKRCIERISHLNFDYILLDPPGATDIFMTAVLAATEDVLIPVRPTDTDFSAFASFKEDLDKMKTINKKLNVRGILFNQVITSSRNLKIYTGYLKDVDWDKLICETSIRMSTTVANAPGVGKDVISYDPDSKVAGEYRSLVSEIEKWHQTHHS